MGGAEQRVVLVTGASAGVGAAAVEEFARRGFHVVATGRSGEKLAAVADAVHRGTGVRVEAHQADFARLDDVRALAGRVAAEHDRIDVLVNNAGLLMRRRVVTEDGHETTWQVNHLAPFLLTELLADRLGEGSRVVTTSSEAHRGGWIDLSDPDFEHRRWSRWRSYCASKAANILFTRELDRRRRDAGVVATCFHPGAVRSDFSRGVPSIGIVQGLPVVFVSPREAADRLLRLAVDDLGSSAPGGYFVRNRLSRPRLRQSGKDLADRLWDLSATQTRHR